MGFDVSSVRRSRPKCFIVRAKLNRTDRRPAEPILHHDSPSSASKSYRYSACYRIGLVIGPTELAVVAYIGGILGVQINPHTSTDHGTIMTFDRSEECCCRARYPPKLAVIGRAEYSTSCSQAQYRNGTTSIRPIAHENEVLKPKSVRSESSLSEWICKGKSDPQGNKITKPGDPHAPPVFPDRLKYRLRLHDRFFRLPVHNSFSLGGRRHRRNIRTETGRPILNVLHPLCKV
jgi:hypothetical protein